MISSVVWFPQPTSSMNTTPVLDVLFIKILWLWTGKLPPAGQWWQSRIDETFHHGQTLCLMRRLNGHVQSWGTIPRSSLRHLCCHICASTCPHCFLMLFVKPPPALNYHDLGNMSTSGTGLQVPARQREGRVSETPSWMKNWLQKCRFVWTLPHYCVARLDERLEKNKLPRGCQFRVHCWPSVIISLHFLLTDTQSDAATHLRRVSEVINT